MGHSHRRLMKLRAALLEIDPYCAYCRCELSEETATADHALPRSRGGRTTAVNIRLACWRCNNRKADRTPQEFYQLAPPIAAALAIDRTGDGP